MSQANGLVALRRAYWLPRSLLATYLIAAGCQSPGVVQDSPGDRVQRERARELIRGIEEEVQIFEIRPLQDPTAIPPERPRTAPPSVSSPGNLVQQDPARSSPYYLPRLLPPFFGQKLIPD